MNNSPESLPVMTPPGVCQNDCRLHRTMQSIFGATAWLAAGVAAISIHEIPCHWDEKFCGVWGCLPPLMSLLSLHLLWVVALAAGIHALSRLRPGLLRKSGISLLLVGGGGGFAIHGTNLARWIEDVPESHRSFWTHRLGYQIAVNTDFPMIPLLLVGLVAFWVSAGQRTSNNDAVMS